MICKAYDRMLTVRHRDPRDPMMMQEEQLQSHRFWCAPAPHPLVQSVAAQKRQFAIFECQVQRATLATIWDHQVRSSFDKSGWARWLFETGSSPVQNGQMRVQSIGLYPEAIAFTAISKHSNQATTSEKDTVKLIPGAIACVAICSMSSCCNLPWQNSQGTTAGRHIWALSFLLLQVQSASLAPAALFLELAIATSQKLLDTGAPSQAAGVVALCNASLESPFKLPDLSSKSSSVNLQCVISLASTLKEIQLQSSAGGRHLQAGLAVLQHAAGDQTYSSRPHFRCQQVPRRIKMMSTFNYHGFS